MLLKQGEQDLGTKSQLFLLLSLPYYANILTLTFYSYISTIKLNPNAQAASDFQRNTAYNF